jgi:hypothetical protein
VPTYEYGPFPVLKDQVRTGITIRSGDSVTTISTDTIDFGGAIIGIGAPKLDANGDDEPAPAGYPAQGARKNSLICNIGGTWYQGGTNTTFGSGTTGELILAVNDADPSDNSRGWNVTVRVAAPDTPPTPSIPTTTTTPTGAAGPTTTTIPTGAGGQPGPLAFLRGCLPGLALSVVGLLAAGGFAVATARSRTRR